MKILSKIFPEVKPVSTQQVEKKEVETKYSFEDEKIKEIFEAKGETLTPEKLEEVKEFLNETEGTIESKLETLSQTMDKDIEVTAENLKTVHRAIHHDIKIDLPQIEIEIPETVAKFPKEIKAEVKDLLKTGMTLGEATKIVLSQSLSEILFPEEEKTVVEKPTVESNLEEKTDELVIKEGNKPQVQVTESKEQLDNDLEVLEEAFEILSESLDEVAELIMPLVEAKIFDIKTPVIKMVQQTMTEKMAHTKQTFDTYQKAITSQLNQIIERPEAVPVKEVLTQVIDKLDHIIMKTDVPLYTDMKTERDLLQSSGRLETARQILDQDPDKAFEIIKTVKEQVDKIVYRPVKQKVFGVTQKVLLDQMYEDEYIRSTPIKMEQMKSSPRAVLETLRHLGINHEAEVSEELNRKGKELKAPANLKAILMKLEESVDQKVQAKDTLENLTGQQLLNKLEIKSQKQQLTFNMPIKVDGDLKHIKVHVNAKKDNQKIDWKNSRLYFVIHLNKLGDTGVLVDVNNGSVNITIKNDTDNLKEQMSTYVEEGLNRLEEIGFKASSIKFERLTEEKAITNVADNFEVSL